MSSSEKKNSETSYETSATYLGRRIVVRELEETPAPAVRFETVRRTVENGKLLVVDIDGREIEILQEGTESFHSVLVPYMAHPSPVELAKAVIDHVPSFQSKPAS